MNFRIVEIAKARKISEYFITTVTNIEHMDLASFSSFLDKNPVIRTIFIRSVNPLVWTIAATSIPPHFNYLDTGYFELVVDKANCQF